MVIGNGTADGTIAIARWNVKIVDEGMLKANDNKTNG